MEGSIISTHGPDNSQEGHKNGETIGPLRPVRQYSPNLAGAPCPWRIDTSSGSDDEEDNDRSHVNDCADLIESC